MLLFDTGEALLVLREAVLLATAFFCSLRHRVRANINSQFQNQIDNGDLLCSSLLIASLLGFRLLQLTGASLVAFSFKEFLFSSFSLPFGPYFPCSFSCRKTRKHDSEHVPCFPAPAEAWMRSGHTCSKLANC